MSTLSKVERLKQVENELIQLDQKIQDLEAERREIINYLNLNKEIKEIKEQL